MLIALVVPCTSIWPTSNVPNELGFDTTMLRIRDTDSRVTKLEVSTFILGTCGILTQDYQDIRSAQQFCFARLHIFPGCHRIL